MKAPAKTTKAVAVQAKATPPAAVDEADALFAAQGGDGLENVTARDLLIPRLTILQDLSPQLKKAKAEYIEGAEVGMICDTAAGEVFGSEILFLPTMYKKEFLEWAPRASNRGLIGFHSNPEILEKTTRTDKGLNMLRNGNHIVETAQFFGFNLSAGMRKCFLPMTSTQLKKARKWLSMIDHIRINGIKPPLYYCVYKLSTVDENNAEGSWKGWRIETAGKLSDYCRENKINVHDMIAQCAALNESLRTGAARAELEHPSENESHTEGAM